MKKPFLLLAEKLYRKRKLIKISEKNQLVYKELSQLYPLKDHEKLYENYQIKKLATVILVFVVGSVTVIFLHLCNKMEGRLAEGIAFSILSAVMVWRAMDSDLKKSCKKRSKELLMDYAGLVSRLQLYLSAGLTLKNVFTRIAGDLKKEKEGKEKHYLQEEMQMACYQLENGVMEEKVYQDFGRRCEEMPYKRLCFLLAMHLKQGNSQLLLQLEKEACCAQEDRRNMAKKLGEEAGTKLLLPMMLMLGVVMFLILLPAYFSFGNI